MLRPLRIVKPGCTIEEDRQARDEVKNSSSPSDVPMGTNPLLLSVARRYRGRGLSLAGLVAAGEEG